MHNTKFIFKKIKIGSVKPSSAMKKKKKKKGGKRGKRGEKERRVFKIYVRLMFRRNLRRNRFNCAQE